MRFVHDTLQAPVHFLVIPKDRNGLTRLSKMDESHKALVGHLMYVAQLVAKQENLLPGFRVVVNDGPDACESNVMNNNDKEHRWYTDGALCRLMLWLQHQLHVAVLIDLHQDHACDGCSEATSMTHHFGHLALDQDQPPGGQLCRGADATWLSNQWVAQPGSAQLFSTTAHQHYCSLTNTILCAACGACRPVRVPLAPPCHGWPSSEMASRIGDLESSTTPRGFPFCCCDVSI